MEQLSDAVEAIAIDEGGPQECYYIYREGEEVPEDATHVRIDSSVGAIQNEAFRRRRNLEIVILNDGLEEIGGWAFSECTSLHEIVIPNTVKRIKQDALYY